MSFPFERERLVKAVENWGHPRLLVIGDLMLDRYLWGEAERVSPEAPVLVLREDLDEVRPGGAANVASFLRGLEAEVILVGVVGDDAEGESDLVEYSYNRQGERTSLTDQRGCLHEYDYDKLGRQIHDRVTTVGEGVDDAVLRLSTTYEVRGMAETLTSWNNASPTLGDAVNQSLFVYNDFQQLIADYQEHEGEVDTGTTPLVQYGYEDGSSNSIRPTTMTYPDGRVLNYDYGTTDGINDAISRICSLIDDNGTTHLADYSFVGLGQFVVVDYTQPDVKYTLVNLAGTNDPDTGDIYSGWERFGRVKDCRWYDYGNSEDVARLKYGYDRASDRLWRADLVAQSLGKDFDELYSYDGLHRLKDMQRGLLNGSNTAITDETFAQCWSLDSTSNWHGFREAEAGGAWPTVQSRTANPVNEITDITNSVGSAWVTPAYDAAGNTTTIPQPADPSASYTATYDAWNRMVGLVDDGTEDPVQQNAYDARNFRVTRFDFTDGDLSEERHFYYTSGWQSIEERLGSSPNSADPERQQIWGQRYIDDLALRDRDTDTNGSLDERLFGLQDANWSVVALVDTSADAQERYCYSLFGAPTFLSGAMALRLVSEVDSVVLFTGQFLDSAHELSLFRARFLNSLLGVFLRRDSLMYGGSLPNLMEYARSSPTSFADPLGTAPVRVDFGNWMTQLLDVKNYQNGICDFFLQWQLGMFKRFVPLDAQQGWQLNTGFIFEIDEDCTAHGAPVIKVDVRDFDRSKLRDDRGYLSVDTQGLSEGSAPCLHVEAMIIKVGYNTVSNGVPKIFPDTTGTDGLDITDNPLLIEDFSNMRMPRSFVVAYLFVDPKRCSRCCGIRLPNPGFFGGLGMGVQAMAAGFLNAAIPGTGKPREILVTPWGMFGN